MRRFRAWPSRPRFVGLPILGLALSCQGGGPSGEALVVGQCADTFDNDGNGAIDCADAACAGYDGCPAVGSTGIASTDMNGGSGAESTSTGSSSTSMAPATGGASAGSSPTGGAVSSPGGAGASAAVAGSGAGGAGPSVDDCVGTRIEADGVLDLDIHAVRVAGNVTLAGAPFPDEAGSRGALSFVDTRRGTRVSYDLEATGAAAYTLTLPPGTYDVVFEGNPSLCGDPRLPSVPCGGGTVVAGVSLTADGVLDVDVPVATLTGAVTLSGAELPDAEGSRGALEFRGEETSVLTVPFEATGPATYGVTLFPGTYDVVFVGNPAQCARDEASAVPCNSGVVLEAASITTGVLDVDVGAVTVSGNVTLSGAALPDDMQDRGAVTLTGEGLTAATTASFGASGAASYALTVLPGTYDVQFWGNPALCMQESASAVPCNGGTIVADVPLLADGALDVDLTPVTVSGTTTLEGAEFPTEAAPRGALAFQRDAGGAIVTRDFGASGPATHSVTLLAGQYDVSFVPNPALCTSDSTPEVPCNGGPLATSLMLTTSGAVDFDVASVRVAGNVSVDGAVMEDEASDRGALLFVPTEGGAAVSPSFGASGGASYSLSLIPGDYTVSLVSNPSLCTGERTPSVPCIDGTLLSSVSLRADGALDVDVPTVRLSGTVRLEGQALPDESGSRGSIGFFHVGNRTTASAGDLRASGDGTYRVTLLPGPYTVSHVANPALCGPEETSRVPCGSQVLLGCE